MIKLELDEQISQELLHLRSSWEGTEKLPDENKLQQYYATFRNRFGPDRLLALDGKDLLLTMKGNKEHDSLIYWLDFKNDAEFPALFGGVAGGSAHKHGLFRKVENGKWISGLANAEKEVSEDQAIEIAKEHRRQMVEGYRLLQTLPLESDEDYTALQQEMKRIAPFVSDTAWGHKYFSLLRPDKLDIFHTYNYHYFHLLKLLQMPPQELGRYHKPGYYKPHMRYLSAGRFARMARSLNMTIHTLSTLLSARNGAPYTYWRIGTTGGNNESFWPEMREGNHCSIGWSSISDLLALQSFSTPNERKQRLREMVAQTYPSDHAATITKTANQMFDFAFTIKKGDLILASEGAKVWGVGQVEGDYIYDPTKGFAHCRPVKWLSLESWKQPDQNPGIEGKLTTVFEMKKPLNLLEAERRILQAGQVPGLVDEEDEQGNGGSPSPKDPSVPKPPIDIFADAKLASISEAQLQQRITRLRRSLLVDESLVRRIYYALLSGHVILAGPPGTGKTELARLLPEILWQDEKPEPIDDANEESNMVATTGGAQLAGYTTMLVTATSDWSTHTLISSIVPIVQGERITYRTRYGYLTEAIRRNWAITEQTTTQWEIPGRRRSLTHGGAEGQEERRYLGHWLVIDEFNRAPIDAALGEALTALSNGEALHVPVDGGHVLLPLPGDFRIIGTLNSFDRHYLNQISEALKRRFSFIEVLPPSRQYRVAEQGIVIYKALQHLAYHTNRITTTEIGISWDGVVSLQANEEGIYEIQWLDKQHPFFSIFTQQLWPLFEILRFYRQLGTAQAIALTRQVLTQGLLQEVKTEEVWREMLDVAFSDTIADQLQVLLLDELEVLLWCLKVDAATFLSKYKSLLTSLHNRKRRLAVHLEALGTVVNEQGEQLLSDEDIEKVLEQENVPVSSQIVQEAFHLDQAPYHLPQFARRLRNFKTAQGV